MNWESCYQNGDTPWDKGAPAPELLHALGDGYLRGSIFVPGCGRGHDVRAIAGAGCHEVLGLDLAPRAVFDAIQLGVPPNARFEEGDLFALPDVLKKRFDWVWEHTCFCALTPNLRTQYVEAIHSALRPGGCLLALFFLNPDLDDSHDGPPFGVSKPELDALFKESFTLKAEWQPRAAYPGREGRELVRLLQRD